MKTDRQMMILKLIENNQVGTQEELANLLSEGGFHVTQATVSRDIKDLRLIKILSADGCYYYALPEKNADSTNSERMIHMFVNTVISIESAYNQIIIKTISGSANVAAETIDSLQIPEILGSVAGDNTILLIARNVKDVPSIVGRLKGMIDNV